MKKFIGFIVLMCLAQAGFSQQLYPPKKRLSPQEYQKKSNNQVILGSILLAGGTTLAFVGANIQKNATGFDFSGSLLEVLGIVAAGGSIPLFISAVNNHNKAKMISANVKLENSYAPRIHAASRYSFPAISVKINWSPSPLAGRRPRVNMDLRM